MLFVFLFRTPTLNPSSSPQDPSTILPTLAVSPVQVSCSFVSLHCSPDLLHNMNRAITISGHSYVVMARFDTQQQATDEPTRTPTLTPSTQPTLTPEYLKAYACPRSHVSRHITHSQIYTACFQRAARLIITLCVQRHRRAYPDSITGAITASHLGANAPSNGALDSVPARMPRPVFFHHYMFAEAAHRHHAHRHVCYLHLRLAITAGL